MMALSFLLLLGGILLAIYGLRTVALWAWVAGILATLVLFHEYATGPLKIPL